VRILGEIRTGSATILRTRECENDVSPKSGADRHSIIIKYTDRINIYKSRQIRVVYSKIFTTSLSPSG
jgi:hypothetical protein